MGLISGGFSVNLPGDAVINKGVGNESVLACPFLISARLLSLAACDGGLSRYRRVAVSFG